MRWVSWFLSVSACALGGFAASVHGSPAPDLSGSEQAHRSTRVVDRDGTVLAESLSPLGTRRLWKSLESIAPPVIQAALSVEDHRFRDHGGIDFWAAARAAIGNLKAGRVVEGGSTLSQQVARMLAQDRALRQNEPTPSRSLEQKLREAHLALRLERFLSKDQILETFLNRAPFGNGAVGIEAAAQRYYGQNALSLSVAQSAFLVGLIRGPSFYNPYRYPERARARRNRVLARMRSLGTITEPQYRRALNEETTPNRQHTARYGVHAVELARRVWRERSPETRMPPTLRTTIDAKLESRIRGLLRGEAARLYVRGGRSAAVVVIEHATGEVLAAVGSSFEDNPLWGHYSAVTAERQPGSALKPFLYAVALAQGATPATLAADIERPFPDTWGIYKPRNYDERYHGPVRYRAALAQSLNVAAVDVLDRVGLPAFFSLLNDAGLTTLTRRPQHYGLGIALGSAPVRLIDLTNAYAMLARGGHFEPWQILVDTNRHQSRDVSRRVVDPVVAFQINDILSDANARAEQFGIRGILNTPYWSAVKTGTSKGYRDSWAVGFSERFTVGVWVGDPTGKPMKRMSGSEGAGPIWRKVMDHVSQNRSRRPPKPAGLHRVRVCALSGRRIGPHCPGGLHEWFEHGHEPSETCRFHRKARLDPDDGGLIPPSCGREAEAQLVTVYPSPYDAWAVPRGLGVSERLSASCHPEPEPRTDASVELLSPAPDERLSLDPDVPRSLQAITFRAHVRGSSSPVRYRVNGITVAEIEPPYTWTWPLEPGVHTVEAWVGDTLRSAQHRIEVR
ncbi:MAG: penicillin-binding protein 1C [Myxococcota bacterium]